MSCAVPDWPPSRHGQTVQSSVSTFPPTRQVRLCCRKQGRLDVPCGPCRTRIRNILLRKRGMCPRVQAQSLCFFLGETSRHWRMEDVVRLPQSLCAATQPQLSRRFVRTQDMRPSSPNSYARTLDMFSRASFAKWNSSVLSDCHASEHELKFQWTIPDDPHYTVSATDCPMSIPAADCTAPRTPALFVLA